MVIFALIAVRGEHKRIESVGVGPIWCEKLLENKVRGIWRPCSEVLLYSVFMWPNAANSCKDWLSYLSKIKDTEQSQTYLASSAFACIMLRFCYVELCSLSRDERNSYQKGKLTVHWIMSSLWSASWA